MIQGLIGRKLGMTQIFDEIWRGASGYRDRMRSECGYPDPEVKRQDGYEAVQLGFGIDKRLNKPEQGHRKSSGYMSRTLREVKADDVSEYEVGQVLKADTFNAGELVDITGTSKGTWLPGRREAPWLRGRPEDPRTVGPLARAWIDRIERDPGTRIQGSARWRVTWVSSEVTVQNLKVLRVDVDRNILSGPGLGPGTEQWNRDGPPGDQGESEEVARRAVDRQPAGPSFAETRSLIGPSQTRERRRCKSML